MDWLQLMHSPQGGEHLVQVYTDEAFLHEAVAAYAGEGLRLGHAVVLICTPEHAEAFLARLERDGHATGTALQRGQLVVRDAAASLERCCRRGVPDWQNFQAFIGGLVAERLAKHANVRAYGEMVDLLWQRGESGAARRLEEFWCDLGAQQRFSLLCAYRMDHLDDGACAHGIEAVCKGHSHLIPTRDAAAFDAAVIAASRSVLDEALAQTLLSVSATQHRGTAMPQGQAMLLWLMHNMPRSADKVLAEVRTRLRPAAQAA